MSMWLVRAGRHGENEYTALDEGVALIGWDELPDLSTTKSKEELAELCRKTYAGEKPTTISNWVGQIWAFRERIQIGDLVVLPLKSRSAVAIGKCTGPYQYRQDLPENSQHTRFVSWIRKDIPRTAFDQDILFSFGAFMTVCQIQRNQAEERIRAMLEGGQIPANNVNLPSKGDLVDVVDTAALPNLEEFTRDQIRSYIGINVQVKSSDAPADVKPLREFQGVMKNFRDEQGLFVSWGGFKQSVFNEARQHFFEIRLWDAGDLVNVLFEQYDRLPESLKAELPLKRIWMLVPGE